MIATATYHHSDPKKAHQQYLSEKSKGHGRRGGQNRCHGLYLVFGVIAIVGAAYGTFLLNQGKCLYCFA